MIAAAKTTLLMSVLVGALGFSPGVSTETRIGTIVSTLNQSLVVLDTNYQSLQTYQAAPNCEVLINDRPGQLGQLKAGDQVVLSLAVGSLTMVERIEAYSSLVGDQPQVPRPIVRDWSINDRAVAVRR